MKVEAAEILALKVGATVTAGTGVVGSLVMGGEMLPFFNVSATTLAMAATGSLLGFAYGTPVKGIKKLSGYAIGGVFVGVWAIHMLRWRGVDIPEYVAGPVAGFTALASRWVIPAIVESVPSIWSTIVNRVIGGTNTGDSK